jgi:GTPase
MNSKFNLYCESGAIVAISNIIQKTCGLVAVGEVVRGDLSKGDTVCIQNGTEPPLYDQIKRIEIDHEEVTAATRDQLVGVCLTNLSKEELVRRLAGN